jgi:cysteinyl-tRNA synthetase
MEEREGNDPRPVQVYDTLSGEKHELEPLEPGKIKMYVCGVTVYDLTHIGHARVFIVFDVVQRFLRHAGYDVTYVRNHTDVDDKIIKRANEVGEDPLELAQRFIEELDEDMDALLVQHADVEPKVSEEIDAIIEMNEELLEKGHAYVADGDVYYRVESFDEYGKLSNRKLDDMEAGRSGRVDEDDGASKKENPFDFALWKKSKEDEPAWDSPWGPGRPGWHIECSVMSTKYLGPTFDIHGGGRDLVFPHHENEIAQSEGATDQQFARNWMHVGMVNVAEEVDGEKVERKMSKSLGNFWTTRDVLGGFHPEAIRYFMHTTQYRKPITYSMDNLEEATRRMEYLYSTLKRIDETLERGGMERGSVPPSNLLYGNIEDTVEGFMTSFEEALADDFNTSRALAAISDVAKVANELTESKEEPSAELAATIDRIAHDLVAAGEILGVLQREPEVALEEIRQLKVASLELDTETIDALVAEREQARADKNWDRADEIRDELADMGIEIMDSADGSEWRVK